MNNVEQKRAIDTIADRTLREIRERIARVSHVVSYENKPHTFERVATHRVVYKTPTKNAT